MHSVGSAISAQNAKAEAASTYQLPHGFKIEPSNNGHTLTCNGYFVFNGTLDDCYIAFGGHLEGVGK